MLEETPEKQPAMKASSYARPSMLATYGAASEKLRLIFSSNDSKDETLTSRRGLSRSKSLDDPLFIKTLKPI